MNFKKSRRRFLERTAALSGTALAAVAGGLVPADAAEAAVQSPAIDEVDPNSTAALLYGRRSRYANVLRVVDGTGFPDVARPLPKPSRGLAKTPLADLTGIITPASLHYTTAHNYGIVDIDPSKHKLMVHGMVERPRVFTVDDLKRLPLVSRICFVECIANRPDAYGQTVADTHGLIACSEWTGVPLSVLLREVGVKNGASWVVAEGAEAGKHSKSVPLVKALDDVLVAYGQNGEAVRPDQGFPLRLIVPGYEGIFQVKWLRRLKVVDKPYATFQEMSRFLSSDPKAQANSYNLGPKSVVTNPSGTHRLPERGAYLITGLAWSGGGVIRRVEVSTDGGKTYYDAEITGPVLPKALTRFCFPWNWHGEEALVQSRCTDELGQVQPSETQFRKYWNNWTREEMYLNPNVLISGHGNWIQPWKVNSDGTVVNGIAPLLTGPSAGAHDHQ